MKEKTTLFIGKLLAIGILTLGIIHDAATFTPLIKDGLSRLDNENLNAVTYISLMCGTSLILCGIILLQLLEKVSKHPFLQPTVLAIGIFLISNGFLSVFYMPNNPFAWIALLLNSGMFVTIIRRRTLLRRKH